ncbi:MAG: copper chaperone PCu(A)C [Roseovarius sp.]|uniref:copper chaperone PCu(A)C n=1 Tax=Roseovarius sp. TaxID=1486281 RepID=UPI0032EBCB5C
MKTLLAATLALALPTFAAAHEYTLGGLEIDHPMAFETAATAKSGGGYLAITNTGESDDALIGAKADFPKVQIHESYEEDGVARMRHVEKLEIPAGETVELAPGGYHVMFMGLSDPFEAGTEIPVTLVFEKAGEVEVMFHVEERSGDGHDHSHDH